MSPLPYREAIRIDLAHAIYGRRAIRFAACNDDTVLAAYLAVEGFPDQCRELLLNPNRPVNLPRAAHAHASDFARRP